MVYTGIILVPEMNTTAMCVTVVRTFYGDWWVDVNTTPHKSSGLADDDALLKTHDSTFCIH